MNNDTKIIIEASIKGADGAVREVELASTWGEWIGTGSSYAGMAARHRRLIGQQKGERAVVAANWRLA